MLRIEVLRGESQDYETGLNGSESKAVKHAWMTVEHLKAAVPRTRRPPAEVGRELPITAV